MKSPLSPKSRALHRRAQAGDQAAITEILLANRGLVGTYAWKYCGPENDVQDLMQMGDLGMLRAIQLFKISRGCKFSTYASFWIRQAILRFVSSVDRTIPVPGYRAYKDKPYCDSMDTFISGDEDGVTTFKDTLLAEDVDFDAPMMAAQDSELLDWALAHLDVRLARILRLRHGIGGGTPKTLRQLARVFGVCAERVRQLERRALRELRLILKRRDLGISTASKRKGCTSQRPDLWPENLLVKAA